MGVHVQPRDAIGRARRRDRMCVRSGKPGFAVTFVGDGENVARVSRLIFEERGHYLGHVEHERNLVREAGGYVLASERKEAPVGLVWVEVSVEVEAAGVPFDESAVVWREGGVLLRDLFA